MEKVMEAAHVSIDVFDYDRNKKCSLYDSSLLNTSGQAYNIVFDCKQNGQKELSFELPYSVENRRGKKIRNFRWEFIKNEYLVRLIKGDFQDWFILHVPVSKVNRKGLSGSVRCSHLSTILKTKNLYRVFDDETGNNIGKLPQLMEEMLKGTGWALGQCDVMLERDGKTEKIRSLNSKGKTGAYQGVVDICNLFNAYPIFNGDTKTVDVRALNNKGPLYEMIVGKTLDTLSKTANSENLITRLYVEGSYDEDQYVGIDDVNPTGLTFLLNFDYYKQICLFKPHHQEALDAYLAAMKETNAQIRDIAKQMNEKENALNNLWGQIDYVFYPIENGVIQKKIIGGVVDPEQMDIKEGDKITVVPADKKYRVVVAGVDGNITLTQDDLYVIKFITLPSATIGAKQVAVAAKEKLIKNLNDDIKPTTPPDEVEEIKKQIKRLNEEIQELYIGAVDGKGLYTLMTDACVLVMELNALGYDREGALTRQENAEVDFAAAMGDMLKDGYWNDKNYTVGQEAFLYQDALDVSEQMGKPKVDYAVGVGTFMEIFGHKAELPDQNSKVRIYDKELEINDFAYVSDITFHLDAPEKDTIQISNEDITLTGVSFDSVMSRITRLADLIDQKNALYDRSQAIGKDGSIFVSRLEGQIDVLKNQLSSSISNWYTDKNGNLVFESATGRSAMMLSGEGFMIANGRTADGDWNWRTKHHWFSPQRCGK